MRSRQLGATGTQVSVLCLGAMTFGEADEKSMMYKVGSDESDEKESFAVLDRALEAGVNFVDAADVYGQDGLSERVLGAWLASRKARDRVRRDQGALSHGTGAERYRGSHECGSCEPSMRASRGWARTGSIFTRSTCRIFARPNEELMRALDDAARAGKIVYFGASNYAAYQFMESLWVADKRGLDRFVTLQAHDNLATRTLEREHVPLCAKFGLGVSDLRER